MIQTESDMKIRILLSAKKLFAQQGFDGTSVRQICEEAGANVALISYYFGGKEKVFRAIFESFFPGHRLAQFEGVFKDPVEGLKLLVHEIIHFSMTDMELSTIVQQEIMMNSPRKPIVTSFTYPVWFKVRELLEKGREEGRFQFDSLDHALMTVIGMILVHKKYDSFQPLLSNTHHDPCSTAKQSWEFILRALGASGSSA
ncbi:MULTISPECIES: TetR family transcriptional regulator [Paenibacillus]|uniref:TetR family transcriptional regulator n=1 Tax=Paenibacillus naphthalenovorans TaxID=162209 RepID=A0A0U2IN18_9BACL|nr:MULTISPECIES: TetR family transcriptional regulator [Paenibacillus]ALS23851.1 TetR family transcriptional regulator [Paenibacillus naphthalenovorans]NTZ16305.1 TetR/AcrR family transcriptional regulator [Paenibacillus sp. JMULE4]GCL72082.1 TetR/AcrR family transcriptional regulator [Paenibacillus naphthalenovorans]SDI97675.1 DNA-binding transcriptional regulator, AcrR family [Paenibacillus naphthalenovorans]